MTSSISNEPACFNLERLHLGRFQCHTSFFFAFCYSFGEVSFIWYFMIWVVNSSDSEQRAILQSDNLDPPGFPHERFLPNLLEDDGKVYLFSTPHGWRLFQPVDLPCCHGAAAKPAATPVPTGSSFSFSNSWVTYRFNSMMKGTASPAGLIHHWSWSLEGNERLMSVLLTLGFTTIAKTKTQQTMAHRTIPALLWVSVKAARDSGLNTHIFPGEGMEPREESCLSKRTQRWSLN